LHSNAILAVQKVHAKGSSGGIPIHEQDSEIRAQLIEAFKKLLLLGPL